MRRAVHLENAIALTNRTPMGAECWSHHVPYQENIQAAFEALREQEFRAGRFRVPDEIAPGFFGRLIGRKPSKPKPPKSIREAIKLANTDATGTRSILDMERISDKREWAGSEVYGVPLGGVMWRVPPETLRE